MTPTHYTGDLQWFNVVEQIQKTLVFTGPCQAGDKILLVSLLIKTDYVYTQLYRFLFQINTLVHTTTPVYTHSPLIVSCGHTNTMG